MQTSPSRRAKEVRRIQGQIHIYYASAMECNINGYLEKIDLREEYSILLLGTALGAPQK